MTYQGWIDAFLIEHVNVSQRSAARLALTTLVAVMACQLKLANLGGKGRVKS